MQIRVFSAARLHEALAQVRQALGPDAVIMDRYETQDENGKKCWHVHAAIDPDPVVAHEPKKQEPSVPKEDASSARVEHIESAMRRLERIVEGLGRQDAGHFREAIDDNETRAAFDHLVKLGVAPAYAFDMASDYAVHQPIGGELLRWSERIDPRRKKTVLLLMGPSGAGKTTLAAKLAAHYSMKGVRVCLLSSDTERMGGTDALQAYADILGIPFAELRSSTDLPVARELSKSAQLMLVDTAGWNVHRPGLMKKQNSLWNEIGCTHRVIVMPANMDEADGMDLLAKCREMDVTQLALSKLDETARVGKLVNWAVASELPLSYCSYSPEVPEQMGWMTPSALSTLFNSQRQDVRSVAA